ncbi:phenylacetate--CoA ligase [Nitratidesulfovibrio sp. SRB-5]|uniref:phenylacetate--CoA ligase n=1 Tax=Nitratidesulfovibrio sp. SRB-5 TaxID=2872636 RepID=UPI001025E3CE|nr:phenylacetate--CoA ligase [Nitratidesulfovibrio sp. SRB-5]MBZ2172118.1 phenylacetate--CoA ligase [Nitratidesulfovibrio sp. SRB-5]RXF77078.1 phenylacetate--CoA ligase family protein [Desulfovibrio sp. DS-1]
MSQYRFLPHLDPETLHRVQTEGLRWTVRHAYANSPAYKAKFDAAGVHPDDIRTLDDIVRLPTASVEDLREGYPLPLLSVPESDVVRIHASSGTTGKRKILAYTQNDVDTFALQMARCYELAGLTREDRVQIAVGYGLWTAGAGFQLGSEKFGALTVPVGPGNLEMQLQLLVDMGVTCLGSTASMALLMAEEVERNGLLDKVKLRKVIFGAETHSPRMRATFEQKLGLTGSYDIAGMTEMYGPGTGLECDAREGLHYWADLFIIEILDPATLQPVAPGEVGEMVVTSLRKEASPLVRYRTRDLTRMLPGQCSCGRCIPRHDHILGRSDDMIIFRGVNIYPGQIADVLHEFPALGSEYHIQLTRTDGRDAMLLQVERQEGTTADADAGLAREVGDRLHRKLMARVAVQMVDPGVLPRSFGKSKRVTDLRMADG